ncbi:hypothetical protein BDF19DRAFT_439295 [Syncephalis fuscata]|nr:hypothetical protein BDF19DRAFT_439295 [Syncephalis fuscata]
MREATADSSHDSSNKGNSIGVGWVPMHIAFDRDKSNSDQDCIKTEAPENKIVPVNSLTSSMDPLEPLLPSKMEPIDQKKRITPMKDMTSLIYDARMFCHKNVFNYKDSDSDEDDSDDSDNDENSDDDYQHPETPERMTAIYDRLKESGLLDQCIRVKARPASAEEIQLFHEPEHYAKIQQLHDQPLKELEEYAAECDSLYFNNETPFCARLSCGGTIELCTAVANGQLDNGMAIVRPPGHHAESNQVVAVKRLQQLNLARRNGTQEAFYDDPNVLFVSIHRFEQGVFYPGFEDGSHEYVGEGAGLGRNINIPWRRRAMNNCDYRLAFEKVIIPIGQEFNPDIVIVSAGFDASEVSPAGFGWMTTTLIKELAHGRVAMILEGGYNLDMIGRCAQSCVKALLKLRNYARPHGLPSGQAQKDIIDVIKAQQPYWHCLNKLSIEEYMTLSIMPKNEIVGNRSRNRGEDPLVRSARPPRSSTRTSRLEFALKSRSQSRSSRPTARTASSSQSKSTSSSKSRVTPSNRTRTARTTSTARNAKTTTAARNSRTAVRNARTTTITTTRRRKRKPLSPPAKTSTTTILHKQRLNAKNSRLKLQNDSDASDSDASDSDASDSDSSSDNDSSSVSSSGNDSNSNSSSDNDSSSDSSSDSDDDKPILSKPLIAAVSKLLTNQRHLSNSPLSPTRSLKRMTFTASSSSSSSSSSSEQSINESSRSSDNDTIAIAATIATVTPKTRRRRRRSSSTVFTKRPRPPSKAIARAKLAALAMRPLSASP